MKFEKRRIAPFLVVVGLGLLLMPASQQPTVGGGTGGSSRAPSPTFTSFSVSPKPLCINFGVPVMHVNYTFDPDGWSNPDTLCVRLKANGQFLHNTPNFKCLNEGTSHSHSFNVMDFFNNAPPATITVTGELVPSIAGNPYHTAEDSLTAGNCGPPGTMPN
jgi:hypothetical protein